MTPLDRLINAAEQDAQTMYTLDRGDGSSYTGVKGRGSAKDGDFQVYVIPVEQRTCSMKNHYRVTFYLRVNGYWVRTNRAKFIEALGAVPSMVRP